MHLFHLFIFSTGIAATQSDLKIASSSNSVTSITNSVANSFSADVAAIVNPILKKKQRGSIMRKNTPDSEIGEWHKIMKNVIQGDVKDRLKELKKLTLDRQQFLLKMAMAAQDYEFLQIVVEDSIKATSKTFDFEDYKADERFQMIRDLLIPPNQENEDLWNSIRSLLPDVSFMKNIKRYQFVLDVIEFGNEDAVKIIIGMPELHENLEQAISMAHSESSPVTVFILGFVKQGASIETIRSIDFSKGSSVYQTAFLKSIETGGLSMIKIFYEDGNFPLKQSPGLFSNLPSHIQDFINEDPKTMWAKTGYIHCDDQADISVSTFLFEKLGLQDAKKLSKITNTRMGFKILRDVAAVGDPESVRDFLNTFFEILAIRLEKLEFASDIINDLSSLTKSMRVVVNAAKDKKIWNNITLYFLAFKGSSHFPKVLKEGLKENYISNEDLKGALLAAFRGRSIFTHKGFEINSDNYQSIMKSLKEHISLVKD